MKIDKKTLLFLLDLRLSELNKTIDELVLKNSGDSEINGVYLQYKKLRRLENFYIESLRYGICSKDGDLDWKEMHHRGWLCKNDYSETFKDELRGLDPEKWKDSI